MNNAFQVRLEESLCNTGMWKPFLMKNPANFREKVMTNFPGKFSLEFSQKFHRFSRHKYLVLLYVVSKSFLVFFRENYHRKSQFKYEISEMRIIIQAGPA